MQFLEAFPRNESLKICGIQNSLGSPKFLTIAMDQILFECRPFSHPICLCMQKDCWVSWVNGWLNFGGLRRNGILSPLHFPCSIIIKKLRTTKTRHWPYLVAKFERSRKPLWMLNCNLQWPLANLPLGQMANGHYGHLLECVLFGPLFLSLMIQSLLCNPTPHFDDAAS